MCGVAGVAHSRPQGVSVHMLARMAAAIKHRGPDGYGFYCDSQVGIAHVRLSVIDHAGSAQPLTNEDGNVVVSCNGEIFNFVELRSELRSLGHRFHSEGDTEVLAHGWEEWGPSLLPRLVGQFAFAIYDRRQRMLFLARDRFGVRPLFFAERNGTLFFASEAKGLFATGQVEARPDPFGLDQVFSFWAALPPRTPFADVSQLEPGCCIEWTGGRLRHWRWYELSFGGMDTEPSDAIEQLDGLLSSTVSIRMRSDVPVGGYLSGGLDSSIVCSLAARQAGEALRTFSIAFTDASLDESLCQHQVSALIGSRHTTLPIGPDDLADAFPSVIRHVETPLVRTAPAAMYLLARLTRECGITVVLSGEGADELFLGYDLFKEAAVRRFCLRQPQSALRPRLLDRLYPYLQPGRSGEFWRHFFLSAGDPSDPLFSHLPRFSSGQWSRAFFSDDMRDSLSSYDALEELRCSLPAAYASWAPEHQASYLEMATLLAPYLLSSQGDRVSMAWGVEGRFPFLDHRLFEFAARLPPSSKLRGLREKDVLRRWALGVLPSSVGRRTKQPFRAPDAKALVGATSAAVVDHLLCERSVREAGYFRTDAVHALVRRSRGTQPLGSRENQLLVGVLSTQLWHDTFMHGTSFGPELPLERADILLGASFADRSNSPFPRSYE